MIQDPLGTHEDQITRARVVGHALDVLPPVHRGRLRAAAARTAGAANRQAAGRKWIWAPGKAGDDQTLYVRKSFDLPQDPEIVKGMTATFWGSCDNVLAVTINGQSLGFSTEWQQPMSHDISKIIKPGKNLIAIRGQPGRLGRPDRERHR